MSDIAACGTIRFWRAALEVPETEQDNLASASTVLLLLL